MGKCGFGYKNKIMVAGVMVVQLMLCILMGAQKKNFFCDEIYSYGLANSENYAFIDPETAGRYSETGWVGQEYFENYLQVSQDVPFSFRAAFENQEKDVHPPLYYCVLHVFSLLNKGVFTKWTGLALNFVFLMLTDIFMLYIAFYLTKDVKVSLTALIFWSFSGAGFSNILFIRMYVMLTCEMLAFVAIHIRLLENRKIEVRDNLAMFLTVVCGGLTHYYFYVLVLCFSAPIFIYFFVNKKNKELFIYGINIGTGAGMALCIFPATLRHVLRGYRGREVIANLALGRDGEVAKTYWRLINESIFAGKFGVCLGLVLLLTAVRIVVKYVVRIEWAYDRQTRCASLKIKKRNMGHCAEIRFVLTNEMILEFLIMISYLMFSLIVVRGSSIVRNRYIYPVYPVIALVAVKVLDRITGEYVRLRGVRLMILFVISLGLCKGSVLQYGIDYMYKDYDAVYRQAQEIRGTDCLLYYGDGWLDVYTFFPLRMLHDQTYFLRPEDVDNIAGILSRRDTANNLTVCLPSGYSQKDAEKIMEKVIAQTDLQNYRMVYKYDGLQEWILE